MRPFGDEVARHGAGELDAVPVLAGSEKPPGAAGTCASPGRPLPRSVKADGVRRAAARQRAPAAFRLGDGFGSGRVAPVATTSQVPAGRRSGNGGPAPGGAGMGGPGIWPCPRRCGTVWFIGRLAPISPWCQGLGWGWSNVTTSRAVAASVPGTCRSRSPHHRYGMYCADGCAAGDRDAAGLSQWTEPGRMRCTGQRHSPQAVAVHQDRGPVGIHEGFSGDR